MRIRSIGVVGAGIMGAGIAALAASIGIPVVLLDIPGSDDPKSPDRSGPARKGLEKAIKARPAAFLDTDRAALITTGNTADHLDLLARCDWIVEAIIEKPQPKQELFAKIERIAPHAIVTSNTSGIPMSVLLQDRSGGFRERFCGTHYFNPVRYMHLLEIIPTPHTSPAVLEAVRTIHERLLGKGIVICKDAPGFVANRIGIAGWATVMRLMMELDLTIDEVDTLTGPLIVARDIAHAKLKERLDAGQGLPQYLKDHPVYYAGPAKTPTGYASGSFGPTTAGRMDSYVDLFQSHGGSMVMLAKGNRGPAVTQACRKHGGFYLGSIGGPAARLAQDCITKVEVLDFADLGMEAVWRIEVQDFPAFVIIDDKGNDFYESTLRPVATTIPVRR